MSRIALFGCPLDAICMGKALDEIGHAMEKGSRLRHASLNVAKLVTMRTNEVLRADVTTSDLITADGMGIVLAARLTGVDLSERVTGVDLMDQIFALCSKRGFRPYILGARQDVLERAVQNITAKHPGLRLAGYRNGYFSRDEEPEIVRTINQTGADCLFVAVPTPMKERFLSRNEALLRPAVLMGVGGSIDVAAGLVRRAPVWLQRIGFEWAFRLVQDPKGMWRRYLTTNSTFAVWLIAALICQVAGRRFAPLQQNTKRP